MLISFQLTALRLMIRPLKTSYCEVRWQTTSLLGHCQTTARPRHSIKSQLIGWDDDDSLECFWACHFLRRWSYYYLSFVRSFSDPPQTTTQFEVEEAASRSSAVLLNRIFIWNKINFHRNHSYYANKRSWSMRKKERSAAKVFNGRVL